MLAIRNLSVLAYANGFTLWHYKSSKDTIIQIENEPYFNEAHDMLQVGDLIIATGKDATKLLVVTFSDLNLVKTSSI